MFGVQAERSDHAEEAGTPIYESSCHEWTDVFF